MICPRVVDGGWEVLKRDELFGRYCERICVLMGVAVVDEENDIQIEVKSIETD